MADGEATLGTITAFLKLSTAQFFTGLEKAGLELGAFESKAGHHLQGVAGHSAVLGTAMMGIGASATAGLGMAIKASSEWQSHMTTIQGNTTLTAAQIKQMGEQALTTARQTGAASGDVADAYMHVTNLGYNLADSQKIVAAATRSAVSANAESATTSKTLAQVMREMNIPVSQAAKTMDTLHIASANSTVPLEEFIHAGSRVFGVAGAMHLSLNQVLAMSVALTKHGFPDASEAMTQMTGIMTHMRSPSMGAADALKAIDAVVGTNLTRDFTAWGMATKGPLVVLNETRSAANLFATDLKSKLHPGMEMNRMVALGLSHILGVDLHEAIKSGSLSLKEYNSLLAAAKNHQADWTRVMDRVIPAQRGGLGGQALVSTGAADAANLLNKQLAHAGGSVDTAYAAKIKTADQQTKIFHESVHALGVEVGNVLLPSFTGLVGQLTKVVSWLSNLSPGTRKLLVDFTAVAGVALTIAGAASMLAGPLAVVGGWFASIGTVAATVAGVFGEIVFAFEAVAGGAATVGEGLGLVVAALGGPVTLAVAAAVAVVAGLALAWKNDFGGIREKTKAVLDWFKTAMPEAWSAVKSATGTALGWLQNAIPNAWTAVKNEWGRIWAGLIKGHEDEWNTVKSTISGALQWIGSEIAAGWNTVLTITSEAWEMISTATGIAWAGIKSLLGNFWSAVKTMFAAETAVVRAILGNAWDVIKTSASIAWTLVVGVLRGAWDVIKTLFNVSLDLVTGHWRRAWETLKTGAAAIWGNIKTTFGTVLNDIVQLVVRLGSRLFEAGKGMVHAFVSGIQSMAKAPAEAVGAMFDKISPYLPHSDAKTGPLSKLTASGRAVGATFAAGIRAGSPGVSAAMRQMVEEAWNARQEAWNRRQQAAHVMQDAQAQALEHQHRAAAYQTDMAGITGKGHQGQRKHLELLAREERAIAENILERARARAAVLRNAAAVDSHTAVIKAHTAAAAKSAAIAQKRDVSAEMLAAAQMEKANETIDAAKAVPGITGTAGLAGTGTPAEMAAQRDKVLSAEATRIAGLRTELAALTASADLAKGKGDLEGYRSILQQIESTSVDITTSVAQEKADRVQITSEINAAEAAARANSAEARAARASAAAARAAAAAERKQESQQQTYLNGLEREFNAIVRDGAKALKSRSELTRRDLELTKGAKAAERFDAYQQFLKDKQIDPKEAQAVYDATLARIAKEPAGGREKSLAAIDREGTGTGGSLESVIEKAIEGLFHHHHRNRNTDLTAMEPHTGITNNPDGTFRRPPGKGNPLGGILEEVLGGLLGGGGKGGKGGKGGSLADILMKILGGGQDGGSDGLLTGSLGQILGGSKGAGGGGGILSGILGSLLGGGGGGGMGGGLGGLLGGMGGLTKFLGPWGGVASLGIGLLGSLFGGGNHGPAAPIIERPGQGDVIHIHNNLAGAFFPDQRSLEHLGEQIAQKARVQKRLRSA